jgi:elongation factor P
MARHPGPVNASQELSLFTMDTSDFRNGISIMMDDNIYTIVEFQHVKPGKGGAFVRSKLKNHRTGNTIEKTWRAGERMEQAVLERTEMQYMYEQDGEYYLMDNETFEQIAVPASVVGDQAKYMKENIQVQVTRHKGEIIGLSVPDFMELEVTQTDPGLRGDTATGGTKPATVETGATLNVPLFVNVGDRVKIDTRTDAYLSRV